MQVPNYTIDKKQTVAGQMDNLLKSDSPYMQQAATAGKQMAGSRGLLNSSMAAGAAQGASIERALPIAQADANTYNAFAGQKYGTQLQGAINNQVQGFTQDNMNLGNTLQKELNQQQQGFQQDNMRLGDTIQQTQMKLQNALSQGDMRLANTLQQQLNSQQQQFTRENMATEQGYQQSNMNLADTIQQGQMGLANQLQMGLNNQQQGFQQDNMRLGSQLGQADMRLSNQLGQSDMRLSQQFAQDNMRMDQNWRSNEASTERQFQSGEATKDRQQQLTMQTNEIQNRLQELGMRFDNDVKLTDIQQQYNVMNNGMNGISAILADPNMSNSAKRTAISNQNAAINSQLKFLSQITGQNLPNYG